MTKLLPCKACGGSLFNFTNTVKYEHGRPQAFVHKIACQDCEQQVEGWSSQDMGEATRKADRAWNQEQEAKE